MGSARAEQTAHQHAHPDRTRAQTGGTAPASPISRFWQLLRLSLRRYYPFTATGSLVIVAGITFTALGNARSDAYQATLGVVAIATTLFLAMLSRLQAGRFSDVSVQWDDPTPGSARTFGDTRVPAISVQATGIRPWFFFRLHARITGVIEAGRNTRFHMFEEIATPAPEQISIPLALPLPGHGNLRRAVQVRDVFGLTRATFSTPFSRHVTIPAPMPHAPQLTRMVAASGEQESIRSTSPEQERYYMREYIPGDRFRDINWKASTRIRELVTRISPQTQDEDRTITVYIRHFRESARESMEAIGHLAYINGWAIAFMRGIQRETANVTFRVITAGGTHLVETDDEISQLSRKLATLQFQPAPAHLERDPAARAVFVFTTPFDTTLAPFIDLLSPVECQVFSTQLNGHSGNAGVHSQDRLNLTLSASALPIPPVRVLEPAERHTVSVPAGASFLEEVSLRPVTERSHLAARS